MQRCGVLAVLAAAGCYTPPELPLIDEIPVVGQPVSSCDEERDEDVACTLDGDTFDLNACGEDVGERVRMLGINAPEISHNESEIAECWGEEAQEALTEILSGREVVLTFDVTCADIYGRTLAYAWLVGEEYEGIGDEDDLEDFLQPMHAGDEDLALLVNEWLVWSGHARVYEEEIFGRLIFQDRLEAAEADARDEGRGLWGACELAETGNSRSTFGDG